jgi:DNA-binding LacI/PurR family transcriptional regulator/DNA-binding transcriptional regulator YhcF (GntR family)
MTELASKPLAKYLQLRDELKSDIVKGIYPQGSKLPTCRELTTLLGASYLTVSNALRELEEDGYVRRQHGKGIYVRKAEPEPVRKTIKAGYFINVKVSIFGHFFTAVLEGLNRQPVYNIPVGMPGASVETTLAENEAWMDDIFHNRFNSAVILGDRHFPFKTLMRYRNELEQINFVFMDNSSLTFPAANRILVDWHEVGYLGAKHFIDTGHRKLAVLSVSQLQDMYCRQMGVKNHDHSQCILDGIEQAYTDAGINFFENVKVVNDQKNAEGPERSMRDIAQCFDEGCTAFLAVGDSRAKKIYAIANEKKLDIGRDVAVVGIFNMPICDMMIPELSSISINEAEIGHLTAQAIREDWRGQTKLVKPELFIRKSG